MSMFSSLPFVIVIVLSLSSADSRPQRERHGIAQPKLKTAVGKQLRPAVRKDPVAAGVSIHRRLTDPHQHRQQQLQQQVIGQDHKIIDTDRPRYWKKDLPIFTDALPIIGNLI